MSELVIDLEHLGYLTRTADPHDGRAKLIGFTDNLHRIVEPEPQGDPYRPPR